MKSEYISEYQSIASINKSSDNFLKIKTSKDNLKYIKKGQKISAISIDNPDKEIIIKAVISSINNITNEDGTISIFAKVRKLESSKLSLYLNYNTNFSFEVRFESENEESHLNSKKNVIIQFLLYRIKKASIKFIEAFLNQCFYFLNTFFVRKIISTIIIPTAPPNINSLRVSFKDGKRW